MTAEKLAAIRAIYAQATEKLDAINAHFTAGLVNLDERERMIARVDEATEFAIYKYRLTHEGTTATHGTLSAA